MRGGQPTDFGSGINKDADQHTSTSNRLTVALAWTAVRDARDKVLGAHLFADPAWDILLELYIRHARGQSAGITKICAASTAPPTTALRWVGVLEEKGLVALSRDRSDRRRTLVTLTSVGLEGMERILDAASARDDRLGLGRLQLVA